MRLIDADALIQAINPMYVAKKDIVADTFAEGCMQFEKLIKQQPTLSQWIPVSERLPQDSSDVLVCTEDSQVLIGWLDGENDWWICSELADDFKSVTAWMPLPEAYKEDSNND